MFSTFIFPFSRKVTVVLMPLWTISTVRLLALARHTVFPMAFLIVCIGRSTPLKIENGGAIPQILPVMMAPPFDARQLCCGSGRGSSSGFVILFLENRILDLLDNVLKRDALSLILAGLYFEEDLLTDQHDIENAGIDFVLAVLVAYGNSLQNPLFFHSCPPVLMSTSFPAS
jgi:hypothetical protein